MVQSDSSTLFLSGCSLRVSDLPPSVLLLAVGVLQDPVFSSHSDNPTVNMLLS